MRTQRRTPSFGPLAQHVVDLENLLGGDVSPTRTRAAFSAYAKSVPISPRDDVLVGVSPYSAPLAAFALPERTRLRIGPRGQDSADIALLRSIDLDFSGNCFRRVYIASGDHIFASMARGLRARGVHVVVVLGEGAASTELLRATSAVVELDIDSALGDRNSVAADLSDYGLQEAA